MTDFDFDDLGDSEGIKQLRKAFEAQKKQIAELTKANADLSKAARSGQLGPILDSLKVSPRVAKYLPSDIEPTKEAVQAWLDEEGDVFGYQKPVPADQPTDAPDSAPVTVPQAVQMPSGLPPELAEQLARILNPEVSGGAAPGTPAGSDAKALEDMKSFAGNAKSFADAMRLMKQAG